MLRIILDVLHSCMRYLGMQHTLALLLKNNADIMIESSSKYIAWMYIDNASLRQRYLSQVDMGKHKGGK